MQKLKIALTGTTGFVGSHLAEAIAAQGHRLTCLLRPNRRADFLKEVSCDVVYGDIREPESLRDLVAGQDVIIHAGALTKARREADYMAVNADGSANLLRLVKAQNGAVQRFVLISSQAAAGPSPAGEPIDERRPRHPITAYGRSKAEAERHCEAYAGDFPITIIRPPAVFGPRDRDVLTLFKWINFGLQPVVGRDNAFTAVSVQNLVQGILASAASTPSDFACYYITDDGQFTWSSFSGLIARALDKNPLRITVPMWLVNGIAAGAELYSLISRRPVLLNRDKIAEIKQEAWLVSGQRARDELGFTPRLSTMAAIEETIRWYRKAGWLG